MSIFTYDEKDALFDVTAVENAFILQYMPGARGDHVKVYLYGLMMCRHPQEDMGLPMLAQELNMTEEEVLAAFRHWEFCGLVHRISDNPPSFRYVSATARMLHSEGVGANTDFTRFEEALHEVFHGSRALHTREVNTAWEWVTDLGLPETVVLMLLNYMRDTRGAGFTFTAAEKIAAEMKEQGIDTVEKAEGYLGANRQIYRDCRAVLKELGKRRQPSEPELRQYRQWREEDGFTHEVILAACEETKKGEPNFAYLNGILQGMKSRGLKAGATAKEADEHRRKEAEAREPLARLLRAMNIQGVTVNDSTLRIYERLRALYPDDEIILLAGQECARSGGRLDDVMTMLESWRARGLASREDVQRYVADFNRQTEFLRSLHADWGDKGRVTRGDRELLAQWREWGFSDEMIRYCAAFRDNAERPMAYLNKVLSAFRDQGIMDVDAAARDRAAHRAEKPGKPAGQDRQLLPAQQYHQRSYDDRDDAEMPDWLKKRLEDARNAKRDHPGTGE
ncbi:MAG: DnaD domain protein [Clostridia bacterium]|nr:DnaD domain protein [Clostridia bacterium]